MILRAAVRPTAETLALAASVRRQARGSPSSPTTICWSSAPPTQCRALEIGRRRLCARRDSRRRGGDRARPAQGHSRNCLSYHREAGARARIERAPRTERPVGITLSRLHPDGTRCGRQGRPSRAPRSLSGGELLLDGTIATSRAQTNRLWFCREAMVEAQSRGGAYYRTDVSVPIHAIPAFLEETLASLAVSLPVGRPVAYGHVGDGNIHLNVVPPADWSMDQRKALFGKAEQLIFAMVGQIRRQHKRRTRNRAVEEARLPGTRGSCDAGSVPPHQDRARPRPYTQQGTHLRRVTWEAVRRRPLERDAVRLN
jgi:FAD/FMN-containing dehydrogenase